MSYYSQQLDTRTRNITSRAKSYELTRRQLSLYLTREEFACAKIEYESLRQQRFNTNERVQEYIKEQRDCGERISSEELAQLMYPVEDLKRREDELWNQIRNAKIIEKETPVSLEDIEDIIDASEDSPVESNIENNRVIQLYFAKDDNKVVAKPGNWAPFYAEINGEHMGYNRLVSNGWKLVDESGNEISEDDVYSLSYSCLLKEIEYRDDEFRAKYPNAFTPWADEDIEKLLDMYERRGRKIAEIADELGRTRNGVSRQLRKLLGVDRLSKKKRDVALEIYSQEPLTLTTIDPSEIDDKDMPEYLAKIERMEDWFKAVRNYAEQQAVEDGVCYDGYEVETTIKSSFSDSQQVFNIIKSKYPDLLEKCVSVKRVSTVRKALGDQNYNDSIASLVEQEEKNTLVKSKK